MLKYRSQVPLGPLTTFRIGGPADYYVEVGTVAEINEALAHALEHQWPVFILAGGSNLLIADHGIRGVVIHLRNESMRVHDITILVDAGAKLLTLVQTAAQHGLAGIEKLAGVPGTVGGAIRGNAGAFGTEIGSAVHTVKVYDRQAKSVRTFSHDDCQFSYRMSAFKTHPELVIVSAEFRFARGDRETLERINAETIAQREAKHPQDAHCAGSFFMNPTVEDQELHSEFEADTGDKIKRGELPAGWLIDYVGLRGKKIGGAQMSPKHPNYLINTGNATAENVIMLASLVKQRVRTELDVELREEVQYVGF